MLFKKARQSDVNYTKSMNLSQLTMSQDTNPQFPESQKAAGKTKLKKLKNV
jgi:hypothetical protein